MARLASGVRKRSDGKLEKRITIDGKRYSIYGLTSKEINEKEQALRDNIKNGLYKTNKNLTLDKYFEEWVSTKRKTIKGSSLRLYISCYRLHISPNIGQRKIQMIERREIKNLQTKLSESVSVTFCNKVISILTSILNDAVLDEVIQKNPASKIKPIPIDDNSKKASETYHRALTDEEQKAFMNELKGEYYYEFIALLLCSGMRFGEASALSWKDIDYKNSVIHIKKTVTYDETGKIKIGDSAKTKSSNRDIPLTESMKRILSMQREKEGNIFRMDNNLVFVSSNGKFVKNGSVNLTIQKTLERLDKKGIHIDSFTAHALRDTFATRFIEQGGQPQTLKTILGHSSLSMTMDLYAHVLPNTKQKEMDNLVIAF